jgi:uncharacterized protein YciI
MGKYLVKACQQRIKAMSQHILIAILKYTKPLEEVDTLLSKHRDYLQRLLNQKKLLVCGRICPRTGGVIIVKNVSRKEFEKILADDPFLAVSEHQIIEFAPSMYDESLKGVIS